MSRLASLRFFSDLLGEYYEAMTANWKILMVTVIKEWAEVFNPGFWALLTGIPGLINRALNASFRTLDALEEYAQDLGLIPFRILGRLLDADLPLPKELSNRIVRMDLGIKWVLLQIYEGGIKILDGDLPAEIDIYKKFAKIQKAMELSKNWDLFDSIKVIKFAAIGAAMKIIYRMLQTGLGLSLILLSGLLYAQIWVKKSMQAQILKYALPQNNPRMRVTKTAIIRIPKTGSHS